MKKRKHRLVIEVTVTRPITELHAASGLRNVLDDLDLQRRPMWITAPPNYVEKLEVKTFSRVYYAERRKSGS